MFSRALPVTTMTLLSRRWTHVRVNATAATTRPTARKRPARTPNRCGLAEKTDGVGDATADDGAASEGDADDGADVGKDGCEDGEEEEEEEESETFMGERRGLVLVLVLVLARP
jgi:hypothetical protein